MKKIPHIKLFYDTKGSDRPVKVYTLPPLKHPQEIDVELK